MYLFTLGLQLGLGSLLAAASVTVSTGTGTQIASSPLSPNDGYSFSSLSPNDGHDAVSPFVSTDGTSFVLNGKTFDVVGTNAYWLSTLNSDEDIDLTLGNLSAMGISLVRTWAFNDVDSIPTNGTWFNLITNRTSTINTGPNGLQKLDTVVQLAQKHGIFLLLCLTNNWNPRPLLDPLPARAPGSINRRDVTIGTNNTLPRNTLSNDFGGMDAYVRGFGNATTKHDEFYTNADILTPFLNYTTTIVSRYANRTSIFAWEIANDPRCYSSIASSSCEPLAITVFHDTLSTHIKAIDKNHMVSSGSHGFLCDDCEKVFPRLNNQTRRAAVGENPSKIRQSWMLNLYRKRRSTRSVDQGFGSAFNGSQGVDSEDILNAPNIDFGTLQLFPDQNSYGIDVPTVPAFDNMLNNGQAWILKHAAIGQLYGKPIIVTGFGLVTQSNSPFFVPFNGTQAPFGPSFTNASGQAFGVTDQQRDDAYTQWLQAGAGIQGMLQYQFSQGNLTAAAGTSVDTAGATEDNSGVGGTALSPNDGYASRHSFTLLDSESRRGTPLAGIVGSAVGGISAIAIIGFLVFRYRSRKKRTSLLTAARPLQEIRSNPFDHTTLRAGPSTAPPGRWTTGYGLNTPKQEEHYNPQPSTFALYQRNIVSGGNPNLRHAGLLNSPPNLPPPPQQVSTQVIPISRPVLDANRNGLTVEIARRELDAGPVPQNLPSDDDHETLPPDYTQLLNDRAPRRASR